MKKIIDKYKIILKSTSENIKSELVSHLEKVDYSKTNAQVQILNPQKENDLDEIIYGSGFYIILTDNIFSDNKCTFKLKNQVAIYRGHSTFVKKRLQSHLANNKYNENESTYKVCLKIEDGVNGININEKPYNTWGWTVVVHKMRNSDKLMREQAEYAFDELYGKPCKSRE
jgi:hypothetical protein